VRPSQTRVALLVGILSSAVSSYAADPNVVVQWNQAVLQGVRDSTLGPPMVARALAIVHTCIYDAWAAYDRRAVGTQFGGRLRRPRNERTRAIRTKPSASPLTGRRLTCFPETRRRSSMR